MNCLRCGRETPGERCFCEECLLDMESYPVKPGTVVQLPPRREAAPQRKPLRRKAIPAEEQIKGLKKRLRMVIVCLVLSLVLLAVSVYGVIHHAMDERFAIGQNYSSVTIPAGDSGN